MKLWRGRTATSNQHQVENSAGMLNQDEQYQQALAALIDVMERAADGDLEVRAPAIEHIPELETFRGSMNLLSQLSQMKLMISFWPFLTALPGSRPVSQFIGGGSSGSWSRTGPQMARNAAGSSWWLMLLASRTAPWPCPAC